MIAVITPLQSDYGQSAPRIHTFYADPTLSYNIAGGCASATLPMVVKCQCARESYQFANVKVFGSCGLYWEGIIWEVPANPEIQSFSALGMAVAMTYVPSGGQTIVHTYAGGFEERSQTNASKSPNCQLELNHRVNLNWAKGVTHKAGEWFGAIYDLGGIHDAVRIFGQWNNPTSSLSVRFFAGTWSGESKPADGEGIDWTLVTSSQATGTNTVDSIATASGFFGQQSGIRFIAFSVDVDVDYSPTGEGAVTVWWEPTLYGARNLDGTFYPTVKNAVAYCISKGYPEWARQGLTDADIDGFLNYSGAGWGATLTDLSLTEAQSYKEGIDQAIALSDAAWGFYPTRFRGRERTVPMLWKKPALTDEPQFLIGEMWTDVDIDLDDSSGESVCDVVRVYYRVEWSDQFHPYIELEVPSESRNILRSAGVDKVESYDVDTSSLAVATEVATMLRDEKTRPRWRGSIETSVIKNGQGAVVPFSAVRCGDLVAIQGRARSRIVVRVIEMEMVGEHTLKMTVDDESSRDLSYIVALAKRNVYGKSAARQGGAIGSW